MMNRRNLKGERCLHPKTGQYRVYTSQLDHVEFLHLLVNLFISILATSKEPIVLNPQVANLVAFCHECIQKVVQSFVHICPSLALVVRMEEHCISIIYE
jgi:ABC-type uncharacterized transport system permease subunit